MNDIPELLPIAQSVNADPHRESELHLRQADEAPQGGDILPRFNLSLHEAPSNPGGQGSGELLLGRGRRRLLRGPGARSGGTRQDGPPAPHRIREAPRGLHLLCLGDDTDAGKVRAQVVDELQAALEKDGFAPVRDRDRMRPGDRISAFMRQLTLADLVVVVISDKYLRSPYCMYEIYKLWQKWQGAADAMARSVVPIVLPEVKVGNLRQRAPYLKHWSDEAKSLEALVRDPDLRPGSQSWEEVRLVREFAHHVDDILVFLNDVLMPRQLEAHLDHGFPAVREALQRWMSGN